MEESTGNHTLSEAAELIIIHTDLAASTGVSGYLHDGAELDMLGTAKQLYLKKVGVLYLKGLSVQSFGDHLLGAPFFSKWTKCKMDSIVQKHSYLG